MPLISFLNQKGGTGKTCLSLNVAGCLAQHHRVLLIDADKQGTASAWASLREAAPFQVIAMARENMSRDALALAAGFDFTIIDGPPHAEGVTRSCIIASNYVAVPIEPGGASLWSSDLTVRQLSDAREAKPALKCGFVLSRKIAGTVLGREAKTMAADVGLPFLKTEIENRIAYAEAMTMGKTIFEWAASSRGAFEIRDLTDEILENLNVKDVRDSAEARVA
jgi:chromosome partitioning protein